MFLLIAILAMNFDLSSFGMEIKYKTRVKDSVDMEEKISRRRRSLRKLNIQTIILIIKNL